MSQSQLKENRLKRTLIAWSVHWIRGALFAIALLAGWYFLETTFPSPEGFRLEGAYILAALAALLIVPPILGYLGAKLLHPILGRWQSAGGLLQWEDRLVTELAPDERHGFPVVLVPWPSPLRTVGVITNTYKGPDGNELAAVFLPNTPDPRKGWLRLVRMSDLEPTNWTFGDLIRFQLSYGSSSPVNLVDVIRSRSEPETSDSKTSESE